MGATEQNMAPDKPLALSVALALACVALAGCPGSLDAPERFRTDAGTSGCFDIPNDLFKGRCGGAGCHIATNPAGSLDLVSDGVVGRLVGKPGTTACPGLLIDPNDAEASVLYTKLTPQFCGPSQMPVIGEKLTDAELQCVLAWIQAQGGGTGGGGTGGSGTGGSGTGGTGGSAAGGGGSGGG